MRRLAAILVMSALIGGCASRASVPPGAIAVPTDDGLVNLLASGVICTADSVPPFVGFLEGDPSDLAWPVWLRAEDGHRMYMTWPHGFSVRFDPDATVLDENGKVVLEAGSPFTFQSVAHDPSKGTKEEPYVAEGAWETGLARAPHCYGRDTWWR